MMSIIFTDSEGRAETLMEEQRRSDALDKKRSLTINTFRFARFFFFSSSSFRVFLWPPTTCVHIMRGDVSHLLPERRQVSIIHRRGEHQFNGHSSNSPEREAIIFGIEGEMHSCNPEEKNKNPHRCVYFGGEIKRLRTGVCDEMKETNGVRHRAALTAYQEETAAKGAHFSASSAQLTHTSQHKQLA